MYKILKLNNNYNCSVVIQDGTERWIKDNLEDAKYSVIAAARVLNGAYITEDDIEIDLNPEPLANNFVSDAERQLLDQIKTRHKIVLDCNDLRIRMNITDRECELIRQIREGDLKVIPR